MGAGIDGGGDAARRSAISLGLKHSAAHRQCPQCKRKGALRSEVTDDGNVRVVTCRWQDCGYSQERILRR